MIVIDFDKDAIGWTKFKEINYHFLLRQMEYFTELLKARGYLYISTVYEGLGVEWNPDDENLCIRDVYEFLYELVPTIGSDYIIKIGTREEH